MSRPTDIGEIVAGLAAKAGELCATLFPNGAREGHEFRIGNLAGEPGRSMAVHLGGGRAGIWCDFAGGEKGDALDLVAQAACRGDKAEAIRWARRWLGLDDGSPAALRRPAPSGAAKPSRESTNRNREGAFRLWLSCQERLAGTPADEYLKGRGIDLARLQRQPRALRFHPDLLHGPTGTRWPALVAAINGADGAQVAVHRTYLQVHCPGRVTKAPLDDPKLTLGRYTGGCIRIWRGASGKSLGQALAREEVVVTEGIEDALTVALSCPERRVLCAVSLANMGAMVLPAAIGAVIICAHNDTADAARRALDRAVRRWRDEGRRVRLARPPQDAKDLNELVQRQLEGAA
jgi:hypothetical protein